MPLDTEGRNLFSKVPFYSCSIRLRPGTGIAEIPSIVSAYPEEPLPEKISLETFHGAHSFPGFWTGFPGRGLLMKIILPGGFIEYYGLKGDPQCRRVKSRKE